MNRDRQRRLPVSHARLAAFAAALAAANLFACRSAVAHSIPMLVPASKTSLQVAVPVPDRFPQRPHGSWQVDETAKDGVTIPPKAVCVAAQFVPQIAADGEIAAEKWLVLANVPPRAGANDLRPFFLSRHDAGDASPEIKTADPAFTFADAGPASLRLSEGERPVLVYNHGLITDEKVPEKDARRSRACYIHPLWGLGGEVLTDDFPKDHYHHHGVFWSWPHIGIDGKEYDLWTYNNITLRFVRWIHRETGPVAAVLAVENGWFVGQKKVMIERVWMRVFKAGADQRAIDLDFTWIPVDRPVTLRGAEDKSYGGLTVRYAVKNEKDARITVPDGVAERDLPDTRLAWADLTTKFPGGAAASGAAIFVPKSHPDYPPTWLTRHYGAMCVGWPGVTAKTFEPGKPIRLSYRIWIHKSEAGVDQLKDAYEGYLTAAKAQWPK